MYGITTKPLTCILISLTIIVIVMNVMPTNTASAQSGPMLVTMGDSIGEGVQSADAAWQTQIFSYLNWVNYQMGADLSLPYIQTTLFGFVGETTERSRLYPDMVNSNVAVSGATVHSLLNDRADAASTAEIDSETDLVLYPGTYTQIEFAEASIPDVIICWIGNNDVLSTVTAFGNMNASQLTPVEDFDRDFVTLTNRLGALVSGSGTKVVFGNIPNVTDIGFLLDRAAAEEILGFPVALNDGHYTTIIGVLLMKIFENDDLMSDPNYVLDDLEVSIIEDRIQVFNNIISREAGRIGMPVVDINTKFMELIADPPVFAGIPISKNILGGLFSLDGIHPSNIGHALLANEFITTMNGAFGMSIPELNEELLTAIFLTDPSIDKDLDGKATGRLGVGLIETLTFLLGLTGDEDDFTPN